MQILTTGLQLPTEFSIAAYAVQEYSPGATGYTL